MSCEKLNVNQKCIKLVVKIFRVRLCSQYKNIGTPCAQQLFFDLATKEKPLEDSLGSLLNGQIKKVGARGQEKTHTN